MTRNYTLKSCGNLHPTRRLKLAMSIAEEAKEHGEALRSISSYLQALISPYMTKDGRERAREKVEAL